MSEVMDSAGNRWQTNIRSLRQGIHHIHDTKEFSDVTFKVGNKYFKAHKLVLVSKCSEFARILLGPDVVDEFVVEDESVTEVGFKNLLHFIYKDDLETTEKPAVVAAFLAGKHYKQSALQLRCEAMMDAWPITVDEVCTLLNTSLNIPMLKNKCLHFMKDHASEVIASPGFLDLDFKSLSLILKDGSLNTIPPYTRIEKVMAWGAKHHTSSNYQLVRDQLLANQPPLLGLLGFNRLTLDEIARVVANYKDLIEPLEVVKFMTFAANGDMSVLPKWAQVAE